MTEYHTIYGPPGTGKTSYLHTVISCLVKNGASHKQIGFMSFTRAAVNEALKRVGVQKSENFCTLHSYAFQALDLTQNQVVDTPKLLKFSEIVGYPMSGYSDETVVEIGDELLQVHEYAASSLITIDEAISKLNSFVDRDTAVMFSKTYKIWKNKNGYIDFNDMILKIPETGPIGVKYLLLDESQDFTDAQWRAIEYICDTPNLKEVHIAGDDDQSIYAWAGANPHGMQEWSDKHNANVTVLDHSYRVPEVIYDLAHEIVHRIDKRVPKIYKPRDAVGHIINLNMLDGLLLPQDKDILILHRNHSHSREIELWLQQNHIPYTFTSNRRSPFDSRQANAARSWIKLQNGLAITSQQWEALANVIVPAHRATVKSKNISKIKNLAWVDVIDFGFRAQDQEYLRYINLNNEPRVKVSTIHGSKGMEADVVVLINSMGERTLEYMTDDEHRVWYVAVTRAKDTLIIVEGDNPYRLM